jgi:hypothetical protein
MELYLNTKRWFAIEFAIKFVFAQMNVCLRGSRGSSCIRIPKSHPGPGPWPGSLFNRARPQLLAAWSDGPGNVVSRQRTRKTQSCRRHGGLPLKPITNGTAVTTPAFLCGRYVEAAWQSRPDRRVPRHDGGFRGVDGPARTGAKP